MRPTLLFSPSQFSKIVQTDWPTQAVDHHSNFAKQLHHYNAHTVKLNHMSVRRVGGIRQPSVLRCTALRSASECMLSLFLRARRR